jgi:uncharacterized coiled-coil DUF342 family protein
VKNKYNNNAGVELLFLLRQQRYLYHQLKMLTDRQQQSAEINSPELLLGVITGRRKLIEKLQELDNKLRPIKANWEELSSQIGPEYKVQAEKIANQVQEIIREILTAAPFETTRNLPLNQEWNFVEYFDETQSETPFYDMPQKGFLLKTKDGV